MYKFHHKFSRICTKTGHSSSPKRDGKQWTSSTPKKAEEKQPQNWNETNSAEAKQEEMITITKTSKRNSQEDEDEIEVKISPFKEEESKEDENLVENSLRIEETKRPR